MLRRRIRSLVVAAGLFVGVFVVPWGSARAMLQSSMTIGPGQTVSKTFGPIVGQDPEVPFTAPADCAAAVSGTVCDDIPITLAVPKGETLTNREFTVSATINWTAKTVNNGVTGTIGTDNFAIFFWENPPAAKDSAGNKAPDVSVILVTPPVTLTIVDPKSTKLDLVVANYVGANLGYTVTLTMTDLSTFGAPVDHSIDTLLKDKSDTSGIAITPSATIAPPTTLAAVAIPPAAMPSTSAGQPLSAVAAAPDPQLDHLKPADETIALGLGPAKSISKSKGVKTGPPGPVSGIEVALAFVIPPGLLLGAGGLAWRRRSARTSTV
jgi:hypothetical protein